ncbi:hypothetical protein AGR2A_pc0085 [Agrobacterium genomosp. 2 str. CFBP 5494]|uniref:Uncharacterized protein n=1 Tax=Agrobacterium genomosp. 2 str. CFBP 5494 TaxID=1183436 RepID=A0A9W5F8N1_9HYPH|nr:hypothetical protein AGR2A_pc0085 [Agrobacterium genomosp. 2 str. CFBP 5494]
MVLLRLIIEVPVVESIRAPDEEPFGLCRVNSKFYLTDSEFVVEGHSAILMLVLMT